MTTRPANGPRTTSSALRDVGRPALVALALLALLLGAGGFSPALAQDPPEEPSPETGAPAESPRAPEPSAEEELDEPAPKEKPRSLGDVVRIFQSEPFVLGPDESAQTVVVIGSSARIEGEVRRDVVVILGELELEGEVRGDAVGVLSNLSLGEDARIGRAFSTVLSEVEDRGAELEGERIQISIPGDLTIGAFDPFAAVGSVLSLCRSIGLLATLLVLIIAFASASERMRVMVDAAGARFGAALLVGFLARVIILTINILLVISLVGIPLAIVLELGVIVARLVGRAALLARFGEGLGRSFGREPSLLGAALLGFVPYAALLLLPQLAGFLGLLVGILIGLLFLLIVDWPALGLVILTRFGTRGGGPTATAQEAPAGAPSPSPAPGGGVSSAGGTPVATPDPPSPA